MLAWIHPVHLRWRLTLSTTQRADSSSNGAGTRRQVESSTIQSVYSSVCPIKIMSHNSLSPLWLHPDSAQTPPRLCPDSTPTPPWLLPDSALAPPRLLPDSAQDCALALPWPHSKFRHLVWRLMSRNEYLFIFNQTGWLWVSWWWEACA